MLDIIDTFTCGTNTHWTTTVSGSKAGTSYTVTWGFQPYPSPVQYDWTCTCQAFQFGGGKPCKHIKQVKASGARCGWNGELEPTATCAHDAQGNPCCPDCGGPVESIRVGV